MPSGGWRRLEDFCNTGPVGYPMYLTSGVVLADEELLAVELGDRVGNAVLEQVVEGWNPLFDLALAAEQFAAEQSDDVR